jgi:hypothetical protein
VRTPRWTWFEISFQPLRSIVVPFESDSNSSIAQETVAGNTAERCGKDSLTIVALEVQCKIKRIFPSNLQTKK